MAGRLKGKVAIITGAATGIGEAIAHRFATEGAKVVVNGLEGDPVTEVVKAIQEHGGEAIAYIGDIAQEQYAEACVRTAVNQFGKLDVLVNNAGVFLVTGETQDYPIDAFDQTIRNNIRSAFLMTRYALPFLQKTRGNVISAGSESGMIGIAENTPYGGTKAWIHAFTQGVAVEQAKYGVRANCVCPGPIDTAWTRAKMGPMNKKLEKMMIAATPLGRRGTVEEVANVYAFLASDEASFVTGALWMVDGGISIAKGPVGMEAESEVAEQPEGRLHLEHTHEGLENKETERVS